MPDSPRTVIGQLSISGGQPQGRAANARAVEPAADLPEYTRGKLYILAEIIGSDAGNAALYRQMLNAAQMAFYEEGDGSQAAALTRAVREAHSVLVREQHARSQLACGHHPRRAARLGADHRSGGARPLFGEPP